jgi:N-methylhydantoinase A
LSTSRTAEGKTLAQNSWVTVDAIIHGTTVADNTLIEMNGACTGLLTTAGISRRAGVAPGLQGGHLGRAAAAADTDHPAPPPPRRTRAPTLRRLRTHAAGRGRRARAIQRLAKQGVESVAICTLFSFVNPAHELRLAELVAEEMPNAYISLSHRCCRSHRSSSASAPRR